MDKNMRAYVAELVGTFAVVFVSAGAVCANYVFPSDLPRPGLVGIALATGLVYAVALAATLSLSGGYLNPAITLMLWVFKRFDGAKTIGLIFVQFLGASLAGGLIRLIFNANVESLTLASMGTPHLGLANWGVSGPPAGAADFYKLGLFGGTLTEVCLTFILTVVIFATIIDPRTPKLVGGLGTWLSPLWVGLVTIALVLVGFGMTGAAMSPARWFGSVIWEYSVPALQTAGPMRDHLVYWLGPIVGTLLGGGLYTALILPPEEEEMSESASLAKSQTGAGSTLFRAKK